MTSPERCGAESVPAVSVIIPTAGRASLHHAVSALGPAAGDVTYEVIVVDNGSQLTVNDRAAAAEITVIRNQRNEGFAPASNQGAGAARGRYLLFLNDDCVLAPGALQQLVQAADRDPEAGAWQPLILRSGGRGIDSAGSLLTPFGFLHHLESEADLGWPDVFAAKGACLLVRAALFEHVGGFPDSYFAYFEDTDLCWRLRLAGYRIRVVPEVQATHDVGATTTSLFTAAQIDYISFRNRLRSLSANLEYPRLVIVLLLHVPACLAVATVFAARGRWQSAWSVVRALSTLVTERPLIAEQRRTVKGFRVKSDTQALSGVLVSVRPAATLSLLRSYTARW